MLWRSVHATMQKQKIILHQAPLSFWKIKDEQIDLKNPYVFPCSLQNRSFIRACHSKVKMLCITRSSGFSSERKSHMIQSLAVKCMSNGSPEELSDEDEELCPVECIREFRTDEELFTVLEKAKETKSLVVVDFYRTSCGSCKYIEQGFAKLCKGSGDEEASVIFLKHNVIDEYDEQSEVAERLRIKTVPLFHFYKDGVLLEAFPTREKERIKAAILKYTASACQNV